jgi:hypothetical protein
VCVCAASVRVCVRGCVCVFIVRERDRLRENECAREMGKITRQ